MSIYKNQPYHLSLLFAILPLDPFKFYLSCLQDHLSSTSVAHTGLCCLNVELGEIAGASESSREVPHSSFWWRTEAQKMAYLGSYCNGNDNTHAHTHAHTPAHMHTRSLARSRHVSWCSLLVTWRKLPFNLPDTSPQYGSYHLPFSY